MPPVSDLSSPSPEIPRNLSQDSGLSRVARGSALNLAGAAISAVCSFALVVVITRGMTRSEAGVFFSVTSIFLVATSIGQLGTDLGLVYFLSRARAIGEHFKIPRYLRSAVIPVLAVSLAMTIAIASLSPTLGRLTNSAHSHDAANYLRTISLFIAPACLATVLLAATRGMGTMRANVAIEQVGRPMIQILLVALAVMVSSRTALGWCWGLPYVASLTAASLWWRSLRPKQPTIGLREPSAGLGRTFWAFTAPRTLASVAQLLMQRIDIVLVGALAGAVQAAVFTASTRFIVAGQMGSFAVSLAVQPPLAAALARHDLDSTRHLFQTSAAWLIGITWPLYLTFCVSGPSLLHVFGHGYGGGSTILLLVTLGMLIGSGCGDVDSVLVMSGRTAWSLANTLLGLAVMIGLDIWLIPLHGGVGAAIGWGGAIAAKNVAGLVQARCAYGLHPFARPMLIMAVLNGACFAGVQSAVRLIPLPETVSLIVALLIAAGAYGMGLWLLRQPLLLDEFRALRRKQTSRPKAPVDGVMQPERAT
jgi:O-antigen/teichoic acid export membrane protein